MVVSAAHFKDVTNGYEKRTDGLWLHTGKAGIGSLRVTNSLPPTNGAGVEIGFWPTPAAGANGYIIAFDHDAGVYRDLGIHAKNLTLGTQGGTLTLPNDSINTGELADGAVTTLKIAPNAVHQVVSILAAPAGSVVSSTYVACPGTFGTGGLVVTVAAGDIVHVHGSLQIYSSTNNAIPIFALYTDGALHMYLGGNPLPIAGINNTFSFSFHLTTLTAGAHTLTLWWATSANTVQWNTGIFSHFAAQVIKR